MRRAELLTGLVVAVLGAYALALAVKLSLFNTHGVPGPGFFPTVLSALLLGLGLLLAATSVRRIRSATEPDVIAPGTVSRQLRAGSVWVVFTGCIAVLGVLGFVPATALMIFVLLFGIEQRRNWRSVAAAVLIPVATSGLFVHLLTIPLPGGVLSHGPLGI